MVRSNELNCRNGWNADLWVAASTDGESQPARPLDPIARRAQSEIEPVQQSDLITSIVAAKTDNIALPEDRPVEPPMVRQAIEEDIFLKQTPSLTWSTGPISNQPATDLVQNPKLAILRARDQFRQRRKHEGRIADQQVVPPSAPLLASAREAQLVHDLDLAEPDPGPDVFDPRYENRPIVRPIIPASSEDRRPVSPVRRVEIERPFPSMTDFPEDRLRFESVPSLDAEDELFQHAGQDDTWLETRQIDTVPPEPYVVDELFDEDELEAYAEPDFYEEEELSVQHRESILNRFLRQRRERQQTHDYVEQFDDAVANMRYQEIPQIAADTGYVDEPPTASLRPSSVDFEPFEEQPAIERPIPAVHESVQDRLLVDPDPRPAFPERPAVQPYAMNERHYETQSPITAEEFADDQYQDDAFLESAPTLATPSTPWNRREADFVRDAEAFVESEPYFEATVDGPTETAYAADPYRVTSQVRETPRPVPRPEPRRYVAPAPAPDDDFIIPPPLPEYQPRQQAEVQVSARSRPRLEQTAPVRRPDVRREAPPIADEFGDQPLFASQPLPQVEDYQVDPPMGGTNTGHSYPAARMERICQTCRDFRPADNGERGWCNNKWAFNHRRMVDADDLACRNSLGSWWTPKDDVWRRDGDISRHAQQTPRVDQWLFGSGSDEDDRRKSGS